MITEERLRQTFSEGGAQEIYQEVKASGDILFYSSVCIQSGHVQVLPRTDGRTEAHPRSNGDRLLQTRCERRQEQDPERQTKIAGNKERESVRLRMSARVPALNFLG